MLKILVKFFFQSYSFFIVSSLFFSPSRSHFTFRKEIHLQKIIHIFFYRNQISSKFLFLGNAVKLKSLSIKSFAPNACNSFPSLVTESIDQIVRGRSKDKSSDVQSEIESISLSVHFHCPSIIVLLARTKCCVSKM